MNQEIAVKARDTAGSFLGWLDEKSKGAMGDEKQR